MVRRFTILALVLFTGIAGLPAAQAREAMQLSLPTENTSLFSSDPSQFYMYTNRSFEGRTTKPWQGGTYGFSRNPKRTADGLIYTKLHEGIDIQALRRSAEGEPLDSVRAISNGKVVHTCTASNHSNYGRYVVIEHQWSDGNYYSLYAHLNKVSVSKGQDVKRGTPIGILGYTGRGINKTRAHLHLEVNLFLHSSFPRYHDRALGGTNHHGVFNGLNLVGIDVAALFKAKRDDRDLSMAEFIRKHHPPHYRVAIPNGSRLEIVARYPWLSKGKKPSSSPWEITFSREGLPIAARPISGSIQRPVVTWVKPSKTYHSYLTKGYLTGSGSKAALSKSGQSFIQFITGRF